MSCLEQDPVDHIAGASRDEARTNAEPEFKRRPRVRELRERIKGLKDEIRSRDDRIVNQSEDLVRQSRSIRAYARQSRNDFQRYNRDLDVREEALRVVLTIALGDSKPTELMDKLDTANALVGNGRTDEVRDVLKASLASAYAAVIPKAWDGKLAKEAEEKKAKDKLGVLASLISAVDGTGITPDLDGTTPPGMPEDCGDSDCPVHGSSPEARKTGDALGIALLADLLGDLGEGPKGAPSPGSPFGPDDDPLGLGGPDSLFGEMTDEDED